MPAAQMTAKVREASQMANDGSAALGAPADCRDARQSQGPHVEAVARAAGREVAGLVGSVAATIATRERHDGPPGLADFGRVGYVAVSATEVAVVKAKLGWTRARRAATVAVLGCAALRRARTPRSARGRASRTSNRRGRSRRSW